MICLRYCLTCVALIIMLRKNDVNENVSLYIVMAQLICVFSLFKAIKSHVISLLIKIIMIIIIIIRIMIMLIILIIITKK